MSTYADHLEETRRLVDRLTAAGPPPAHTVDQWAAAAADAQPVIAAHIAAFYATQRVQSYAVRDARNPGDREALIRLAAAARRCRSCPHLRRRPLQPAVVELPLHRIVCARCMHTRRNPPPGEAQQCDVCGGHVPDNMFRAFTIPVGHVVYGGDAGACCDRYLFPEAA